MPDKKKESILKPTDVRSDDETHGDVVHRDKEHATWAYGNAPFFRIFKGSKYVKL